MSEVYSALILMIAITNGVAAWYGSRTFNALRRTDVGDRFVWGFTLTAISWGFFSLGSQQFFEEPSELRTLFILLGLTTKLIGVIILVFGIRKLGEDIGGFR